MMTAMTVASRIARNTIIATGARVLGTALSFVVVAIIARSLGAEAFGNYTLILSFLFTFQVFADGGLYTLLLRELSRSDSNEGEVVGNIIALRIVLLVVVLGFAPLVVLLFPYENTIPIGVALAGIGFFFLSFSQMFMAVFQKELRLFPPALAEVVGRIAQFVAVIVAVLLGASLFFFLIALVVGAFVQWIINYRYASKIVQVRLRFNWSRWRHYIRETAPIAVSAVFVMIYFRIDSIFLSLPFINRASASPLMDVGQYGLAYKVFESLIFYPSMFVGLLMPFFSRFATENIEKLRSVTMIGARVLLIVAVPAVLGLIYLAEPIIVLIGGIEFLPAVSLLQLLSVALGFVFFGALYGNLLIALGKQRQAAWIYGIGALLNVVLNILAIPIWQSVGAASTTVLTEIIVTIALATVVMRSGVLVRWKGVLAIMISALGMSVALFLFGGGIVSSIVLGIVVYGGLLILFRGISRQEISLLLGRKPTFS